jgi:hypothetical protein
MVLNGRVVTIVFTLYYVQTRKWPSCIGCIAFSVTVRLLRIIWAGVIAALSFDSNKIITGWLFANFRHAVNSARSFTSANHAWILFYWVVFFTLSMESPVTSLLKTSLHVLTAIRKSTSCFRSIEFLSSFRVNTKAEASRDVGLKHEVDFLIAVNTCKDVLSKLVTGDSMLRVKNTTQ